MNNSEKRAEQILSMALKVTLIAVLGLPACHHAVNNIDLSGQDLRLTHATDEFKGRNLRNANLAGANLKGFNLSGANLRGANLEGTDLSQAVLSNMIVENAVVTGVQLGAAQNIPDSLLPNLPWQ